MQCYLANLVTGWSADVYQPSSSEILPRREEVEDKATQLKKQENLMIALDMRNPVGQTLP